MPHGPSCLTADTMEAMLAYVFWHSPVPGIASEEYVHRLHTFHEDLNGLPADGLLSSNTWRVEGVPWLAGPSTFEDWYVLRASSYLDTLAEVALSHRLLAVHDAVAHLAGSGTAGLYKPARASEATVLGSVATWFNKPPGESYSDFYAFLDAQDTSIAHRHWQRFLTLGPGPEFCVVGEGAVELPATCAPVVVRRSP